MHKSEGRLGCREKGEGRERRDDVRGAHMKVATPSQTSTTSGEETMRMMISHK